MRRSLLIIPALVVAATATAGGWYALRPDTALPQARALMQAGDLRGAQLVLRELVRKHPEMAEAHLRLGTVQMQLHNPAAAEHELREASQRGADEHAVRPLLAQAMAAQGAATAVLRDFTADGLDGGQAADLHTARGLAAASQQQPGLAHQEAAAALAAMPGSAPVALSAARVLQAAGDPAGANEVVDQALATAPHLAAALVLRGQVLTQQGKIAPALAAYDAALAEPTLGEDASAVRIARASLNLAGGDDAAARADVAAVLAATPRSAGANYLQALLHVRAGQWKAADEALAAVGPALPQIARSDLLLATVKANVGEPQQALDAAERFNSHNPRDIAGAKLLAEVDLAQGRAAAATQLLTPWSAPDRADAEILGLLSRAYAMGGQGQQAQTTLQQAASLSGGNADMLVRVARIAAAEGNPALAADMLQAVLGAALPVKLPGNEALPAPSRADAAAGLVVASLQSGQIDRAAAAIDSLRGLHGDPQQLDLLTGAVRLAQFDLPAARAAFEQALARNPGLSQVTLDLSRVLRLQGDTAGADGLLRSALVRQPANPLLVRANAEAALARNAPGDAVAAGEAAHATDPASQPLSVLLATVYLQAGQPAKALDLANAMPDSSPAQLALRAEALNAMGRPDDALAAWQALLAKASNDVALRLRLVQSLTNNKRDDAAAQIIRDGLATAPDNAALQGAAVALAARIRGLPAGLAQADEFAARTPGLPASLLKGDLLLASGKAPEAAAAYAQARTALPKDTAEQGQETVLLRQAQAMAAAGDGAGATKLMQGWMAAHPASMTVLDELASIDLAAGRTAEARSKFEAVLKTQPNAVMALNNLAWIERQQGQLDSARTHAAHAYMAAPSPATADTFGWVLLAAGRPADALPLLRLAANVPSPDPAIQYHLAAALKQAGRPDEARAVLKPAIDGGAPFTERPEAQTLMQALSGP